MSMKEWPFVPDYLTGILPTELVEFIQSGSSVQMKMPVAIVEIRPGLDGNKAPVLITAHDKWLNFSTFCRYLSDLEHGPDAPAFLGGRKACEECDASHALAFINGTLIPDPDRIGAHYRCHMGLWDLMAPINVAGKCVAVLFAGQRGPMSDEDRQRIEEDIDAIGTPAKHEIRVGNGTKDKLKALISECQPYSPNLLDTVEEEAKRVAGIADNQRDLLKIHRQEEFIASLRTNDVPDKTSLDSQLEHTLETVVAWCRLSFACVFATKITGGNVLGKFLARGLPADIAANPPHFNWRRAGLPDGSVQSAVSSDHRPYAEGIRGTNAHVVREKIRVITPVAIPSRQRAVLCLGGFPEGVDLTREADFLQRVARRILRPYLEHLQIFDLSEREEQWEDATSLIAHHVRTALNPIKTGIGIIRRSVLRNEGWITPEMLTETLSAVDSEVDLLSDYATETLEFWRHISTHGKKAFEKKSVAQTIKICVGKLRQFAKNATLDIVVDPNIAMLPQAELVGNTLDVAITNVLENAIKYSFDNRRIDIRAWKTADNYIVIEIENFGIGIPYEEREKIFLKRYRGKYRGTKTRKEGGGLGLWQAREILRAHGGDITGESYSGGRQPKAGDVEGFRTIFVLTFPVEQKHRKEDEGATP